MNWNIKTIIIFLFSAILVVYFQYEKEENNIYELPSSDITYIDENIFSMFSKRYPINNEFNQLWGFPEEIKKKKNIIKKKKIIKQKIIIKKLKEKNILCISSSCYRLLGIHYNNSKVPILTLYNKKFTKKIIDYETNAILELRIRIQDISINGVEFVDLNTSNKYYFKIFDVNQSKYHPKGNH